MLASYKYEEYICSTKRMIMTTVQKIRIESLEENISKTDINGLLLKAGVNAKHINIVYQEIIAAAIDWIITYNKRPNLKTIIVSEINFYFGAKSSICK